MKRVNLHIDKLVLRGFKNEDRQGIADGIQQELGRMFSDPQAARKLTANGDVPRLRIGNIPVDHSARPQYVGLKVAQGIGKGMKK
jgi:hypothetical protein